MHKYVIKMHNILKIHCYSIWFSNCAFGKYTMEQRNTRNGTLIKDKVFTWIKIILQNVHTYISMRKSVIVTNWLVVICCSIVLSIIPVLISMEIEWVMHETEKKALECLRSHICFLFSTLTSNHTKHKK